jgi:hypothetical protein
MIFRFNELDRDLLRKEYELDASSCFSPQWSGYLEREAPVKHAKESPKARSSGIANAPDRFLTDNFFCDYKPSGGIHSTGQGSRRTTLSALLPKKILSTWPFPLLP